MDSLDVWNQDVRKMKAKKATPDLFSDQLGGSEIALKELSTFDVKGLRSSPRMRQSDPDILRWDEAPRQD